jgi:hypothetical protein
VKSWWVFSAPTNRSLPRLFSITLPIYLSLVATIRRGIEVEIGTFDYCGSGDDLLDYYRYGFNDTTEYRRQTPEEKEEPIRYTDLNSRQTEKGREKIDRSLDSSSY